MRSNLRAMIAGAVIAAALAGPAFADDLEGAYVGAGIGLGRIEAGTAGLAPSLGNIDQSRFAYHLDFGIHPPSVPLALELEYVDLGESHVSPSAGSEISSGTVSQRGGGLFLLYYLPTPIVQVYVKGGGSRITTHTTILSSCTTEGCNLLSLNPTNNAFAYGAGLQWSFGRWAARGEYERFNAGGGQPSLLTVGISWTFL